MTFLCSDRCWRPVVNSVISSFWFFNPASLHLVVIVFLAICDVIEELSVLLKMPQDPVCCKGMNSMNNFSSFGTGILLMVQIIMPQVL
jgi:hypothetical protein